MKYFFNKVSSDESGLLEAMASAVGGYLASHVSDRKRSVM